MHHGVLREVAYGAAHALTRSCTWMVLSARVSLQPSSQPLRSGPTACLAALLRARQLEPSPLGQAALPHQGRGLSQGVPCHSEQGLCLAPRLLGALDERPDFGGQKSGQWHHGAPADLGVRGAVGSGQRPAAPQHPGAFPPWNTALQRRQAGKVQGVCPAPQKRARLSPRTAVIASQPRPPPVDESEVALPRPRSLVKLLRFG
jgi:hypothetical protein